jgi:hypothetical protein
MSWKIEIPIIVRSLINDMEAEPKYSDDRLLQLIAVSAKYVQFDVALDHEYTINVVDPTITPDPTEDNDSIFISLVALKAACMVDQSEYRTKAINEGVRAALGPASLSIAGNSAAWKVILDQGACALYEELTSHWDVKEATAIRAVLSPFVGNKFDPRSLNITHNHRHFF